MLELSLAKPAKWKTSHWLEGSAGVSLPVAPGVLARRKLNQRPEGSMLASHA
jgi:hypothetical protein